MLSDHSRPPMFQLYKVLQLHCYTSGQDCGLLILTFPWRNTKKWHRLEEVKQYLKWRTFQPPEFPNTSCWPDVRDTNCSQDIYFEKPQSKFLMNLIWSFSWAKKEENQKHGTDIKEMQNLNWSRCGGRTWKENVLKSIKLGFVGMRYGLFLFLSFISMFWIHK